MAADIFPGEYRVTFVPSGVAAAQQALSRRVPLGSTLHIDVQDDRGQVPVKLIGPGGETLIQGDGYFNGTGGLQLKDATTDPAEVITLVGSLFFDSKANQGRGYKFLYGFVFIGDPEAAGGWGAEGG